MGFSTVSGKSWTLLFNDKSLVNWAFHYALYNKKYNDHVLRRIICDHVDSYSKNWRIQILDDCLNEE